MNYTSTNGKAPAVSFREAVLNGLAPDGGLYMPMEFVRKPADFINRCKDYDRAKLAFELIEPYVGTALSKPDLYAICEHAVDFDFPLRRINEDVYSLELFHGPTLAFKDVGARFLSGCIQKFLPEVNRQKMLLVATSGDTGGAVAHSFEGMDDVQVVILYPAGKVSLVQELQLTTMGNNIRALKVDADFDTCQQLVKSALADRELQQRYHFISANSINIARWLSQQFYYWFALQQWPGKTPPVISVPSGNLGNLCAGLAAHVSGMSAAHFIAACNQNDTITRYFSDGVFDPHATVPTLSNAMDVSNPNNFSRMTQLMDLPEMTGDRVSSYAISDEVTTHTILDVWNRHQYLLDPHTAVSYSALQLYLEDHPGQQGIVLGTAHPVKFREVLEPIICQPIAEVAAISGLVNRKKTATSISGNGEEFRSILINGIG